MESAGGERVDQSYLAGYNVDSGELVRSFRPTFNGQIKALEALPNNRLAVGGEFTEVNGEKVNHFVILDATTGQIDRTWDLQIQRRNGDAVQVKTLLVQDGYLYIGGNFTHVKGNTSKAYAYSRGAARIKLSNARWIGTGARTSTVRSTALLPPRIIPLFTLRVTSLS